MNEIINILDKGDVKRNIITQVTSPGEDLLSVHAYLLYSLFFENGIFFFRINLPSKHIRRGNRKRKS